MDILLRFLILYGFGSLDPCSEKDTEINMICVVWISKMQVSLVKKYLQPVPQLAMAY